MSFLKNRFVRNKEIVKISLFFLVVSLLPVFYVLVKRFFKIDTVLDLKEALDMNRTPKVRQKKSNFWGVFK